MKQVTILIAALVLTFAKAYSADMATSMKLSDFDQYTILSSNDDNYSYTPNSVEISTPVNSSESLDNADVDELNEKSLLSEEVIEPNEKESSDEFFDGSAGAMGLGIF